MTLIDVPEDTLRAMCDVLEELTDQPNDYNFGNIARSVRQQLDLAQASRVTSPSVDACDNPYGDMRPLPIVMYRPDATSGPLYTRPGTNNEMYIAEFANEGIDYHSGIGPDNPSLASRALEALNGYWPALKLINNIVSASVQDTEDQMIQAIEQAKEFLAPREEPKVVRI